MQLGIDIETYSSVSLKKSGMHKYTESPDFQITILGYSLDGQYPVIIDMANGDKPPDEFYKFYNDPDVLKTAFNAQFEITCFNQYLEFQTSASEWECTMIKAAMLGLPMSLDMVGQVLDLDVQKSKNGKALIKFFTMPTKTGTRNMPKDYPNEWKAFKEYNKFDVQAEQGVRDRLSYYKIPVWERRIWVMDQKINARGVMLDKELIEKSIGILDISRKRLFAEAVELTGLNNPNSPKQLKEWLADETQSTIANLTKESVKELLIEHDDPRVVRLLEIRQEMAKSSVKKYPTMQDCLGRADRARGLIQLYGAGKTGRWAGRLIQVQNLTKTSLKDIDLARQTARRGDLDMLELLFGNVTETMSKLIRTAFIPRKDNTLLVSDFSAIEARVLAWFADEVWRMEVFRGDGKIYEASGARMFKTTPEAIAADRDGLRFRAKTAELALGFQGSVGAIVRMEEMGLKTGLLPHERKPLVDLWRANNKKIVQFWYDVDEAAIEAVMNPGRIVRLPHLQFLVKHQTLFIRLPSGRFLSYVKPFIRDNKFDRKCVAYWGIDDKNKWSVLETYGGKLVENIVQGTSRDVLADAMLRLDEAGFEIVMHVHDEVVSEVSIQEEDKMLKKAGEIMDTDIPWADGLPLRNESFLTPYYVKN